MIKELMVKMAGVATNDILAIWNLLYHRDKANKSVPRLESGMLKICTAPCTTNKFGELKDETRLKDHFANPLYQISQHVGVIPESG